MPRTWGEGEDEFPGQWVLQQQAILNALRGRRGQALLCEIKAALLALPAPRLIARAPAIGNDVCLVGAWACWKHNPAHPADAIEWLRRELERRAGVNPGSPDIDQAWRECHDDDPLEADDYSGPLADLVQDLGVVDCLSWHLQYQNDEGAGYFFVADDGIRYIDQVRTPEDRWTSVMRWIDGLLARGALK